MKSVFHILALFLICSLGLLAQSRSSMNIESRVVDAEGEPLMGATIVGYLNGNYQLGLVSDWDGFFEINTTVDSLVISYLSYESRQLNLDDLLSWPQIEMHTSAYELAAAVVTAPPIDHCSCAGVWRPVEAIAISQTKELRALEAPLQWKAYPNPTADIVYITTTDIDSEGLLLTANGQLLKRVHIAPTTTMLDLTAYPAGHYYIQYEGADSKVQVLGPLVRL